MSEKKTHGKGLAPPEGPSELIPLLDISIDENLCEVLNEFAQNSSAAISESVLAQTEPSAKLLPLVY